MLDGFKTYIVAAAAALVAVLNFFGWITPDQFIVIESILGPLGFASIRHGMKTGAR